MVSERMDKAGESQANHFSVNLQAGRSKLVLSITQVNKIKFINANILGKLLVNVNVNDT